MHSVDSLADSLYGQLQKTSIPVPVASFNPSLKLDISLPSMTSFFIHFDAWYFKFANFTNII